MTGIAVYCAMYIGHVYTYVYVWVVTGRSPLRITGRCFSHYSQDYFYIVVK